MVEIRFGENLRKLREKNHLTRNELGQKLGVSAQMIYYYEKGERETNFATLIKISEIFGISLDRLVCGNPADLDVIDSVQLALAENTISCTIPVSKQDLFVTALPYAGEIINSVMSAVQEVEKSRRDVEVKYIFSPADAQIAKDSKEE